MDKLLEDTQQQRQQRWIGCSSGSNRPVLGTLKPGYGPMDSYLLGKKKGFDGSGYNELLEKEDVSSGTTIIACCFPGGVVMGCDTRTSSGSYVVNRAARKITQVHERIFVCRSGSAADTQAVTNLVKVQLMQFAQQLPIRTRKRLTPATRRYRLTGQQQSPLQVGGEGRIDDGEGDGTEKMTTSFYNSNSHSGIHEERSGRQVEEGDLKEAAAVGHCWDSEIVDYSKDEGNYDYDEDQEVGGAKGEARPTVARIVGDTKAIEILPRVNVAASLFQGLCYEYKEVLTVGLLVAGWDAFRGPQIYSIPLGGVKLRMPYAASGSGSTYITGFLDANYRPDMNKCECICLVKKAVALAIARDGYSGGLIRIIVVMPQKIEEYCCYEGHGIPYDLWDPFCHSSAGATPVPHQMVQIV